MRCITVRQPWAFAIAHLDKRVENRSQLFGYRGELAIHAGLTGDPDSPVWGRMTAAQYEDQARGAILATTTLDDCHVATRGCCDSPWAQYAPKGSERVVTHLVLGEVHRLRNPVPARGWQGLWKPTRFLQMDIDEERRAA